GERGRWSRDRHGRREKKSASGTPKRHRASLSAATGKVLTRFTRRRPSDLRHAEYNPGLPRGESVGLVLEGEVGAIHVYHVLPAAIGLLSEDLDEFALVRHAWGTLGLGHRGKAVVAPVVGQVTPSLNGVRDNLEANGIDVEKPSPERFDCGPAVLRRQVGGEERRVIGVDRGHRFGVPGVGSRGEGGVERPDGGLVYRRQRCGL